MSRIFLKSTSISLYTVTSVGMKQLHVHGKLITVPSKSNTISQVPESCQQTQRDLKHSLETMRMDTVIWRSLKKQPEQATADNEPLRHIELIPSLQKHIPGDAHRALLCQLNQVHLEDRRKPSNLPLLRKEWGPKDSNACTCQNNWSYWVSVFSLGVVKKSGSCLSKLHFEYSSYFSTWLCFLAQNSFS